MDVAPHNQAHSDGEAVKVLYESLLESWNGYNPDDFADLFAYEGNLIGFDGSQINGYQEIRGHVTDLFEDHQPPAFIGIIREVRPLSPTLWLLRAVASMVSPDEAEIHADLNSIHTLIARKDPDGFYIVVFQSTPAALHERPDLRKQLTKELKKAAQELKTQHHWMDHG